MKKISILAGLLFSSLAFSQNYWTRVSDTKDKQKGGEQYYQLDIDAFRKKLNDAKLSKQEYIVVEVPNLEGTIEKFRVKSFSVMSQATSEKYQLGSYTGVSLSNPYRTIRFSISPNSFQSMISDRGVYQFIDPDKKTKGVYRVHPKTKRTKKGKAFECSTSEGHSAHQIDNLYQKAQNYQYQTLSKLRTADDKKFRTLRMAISVTGEYTQLFGGVEEALAQINATMTRVNGVFETDLALHINVIDAPQIIFTNPETDPYSDADEGASGIWSWELQKTLTSMVGEENYDIGHLFGASGGGGNAGCLGCICVSPALDANGVPLDDETGRGKGSAFTSPITGFEPSGDEFDIDFVAHEIGHQLGANHTFSYAVENTGSKAQIEPGSGSTIMGYAGITGYSDIQEYSDTYFSVASLNQIQRNLEAKTCDHEISITQNTAPVIEPLQNYTIPKGTPFVLTAKATDAEGDPLTYTWEQTDAIDKDVVELVSDRRTTGANFRSVEPSENPTRYFPKFESVMAGNLVSLFDWETVSNVARTMNFAVTVRDNNVSSLQPQVSTAEQQIIVSDDGPFEVKTNLIYYNAQRPIEWEVANTNQAPYNVENVKIDYTADGGNTWVVLAESTPNDGSEVFSFPESLENQDIQIRITSIGHIFYTVSSPIKVLKIEDCNTNAPSNFELVNEQRKAVLTWQESLDATYQVRYKLKEDTDWTIVETNEASYEIPAITLNKIFEVQVANVCNGVVGDFTEVKEFSFASLEYCSLMAEDASLEFVSRVKIEDSEGNVLLDNTSDGIGYSDFSTDTAKTIVLKKGSKGNKLSITIAYPTNEDFYETLSAWIDFNGDGQLSEDERIVKHFVPDPSNDNVGTIEQHFTFDVPEDITTNPDEFLKLRIALKVGPSINSAPASACDGNLIGSFRSRSTYKWGEVEDYRVMIK